MSNACAKRWLFRANWESAVFIHFRIPPTVLQPMVPLELDVREGWAYLSLVAFTQRRLRPVWGGRFAKLISAPLAEHDFLNLRTYVRAGEQRGIYFIAEWIPNRLAVLIGPRTYGLPYRLASHEYRHDPRRHEFKGRVSAAGKALIYRATSNPQDELRFAAAGSLEKFLLERYVAFTARNAVLRRFRVSHAPWMRIPVCCSIMDATLVSDACDCFSSAELVGAQFSWGVQEVLIGLPEKMSGISRGELNTPA